MAAAMSFCNSRLPIFTISTPFLSRKKKPFKVFCGMPSSTPRKFTIRRNYLRQKLLKTLSKPLPNSPAFEPTPPDPLIPVEIEAQPEEAGSELLEIEQFQEADLKESSSNPSLDGVLGNLPKFSVGQYVFWLIGAFVVYAIVVVLDIGLFEYENEKHGKRERKNGVLEVGLNTKMTLGNGEVVYLDEDEMLRKVEDIRMMAREARAKERLEGKRDVGYESDEEEEAADDDSSKSGIEKEVMDRLVKLSKKLEKNLPVAPVDNAKKDVVNGMNKNSNEEALMFKKKYKYKGLSSRPTDKSKGFTGRIDEATTTSDREDYGTDAVINGDIKNHEVADLSGNGNSRAAISIHSKEDGLTNVSDKPKELKKVGKSRSKAIESKPLQSEIGNTKSESETEPWWTRLPYVLVILMQGEYDGHVTGLFTLRNLDSSDKNDLPHTVAFEDRVDAANFCYLVQSFFEDLEGSSAEVVPIPIKELIERVKSQTMKVLVVKKGQLKLFVGQPLQDAEMALRALIDQS
ncbi:OLC1v1020424C1 [Oldenlandia corymbosa var. corymbosa]|uniref:OLC1v1020424C1 n=1 Tax=Oldenlandia corymbosa var. corymbosa TaxID=529605 RepID=A0AAV1EGY5_OLDCO|nr:OLC1v1020424C1 [Oldenlandia corymbosa var. corymbosa]